MIVRFLCKGRYASLSGHVVSKVATNFSPSLLCGAAAASAMPLLNLVLLAAPWRKMHCSQKKKRERNLFCISQPFIFPSVCRHITMKYQLRG